MSDIVIITESAEDYADSWFKGITIKIKNI